MKNMFVEFSMVILANDHNPTILNPDFLQRTEIINDEWGWQIVGQPITTPAIATIKYDSKISITAEPMKLQVNDSSGVSIDKSHVCEIVSNYVQALPHVKYSSLGINFTIITMVDDVDAFLFTRYLKEGKWNNNENTLIGAGYKFIYQLDNGVITFSIDKGAQAIINEPFIVSRANFHRELDLDKMPTETQIIDIISNVENDWKRFEILHADIIEN